MTKDYILIIGDDNKSERKNKKNNTISEGILNRNFQVKPNGI